MEMRASWQQFNYVYFIQFLEKRLNCYITLMVEISKKVGTKDEEKVDLTLSKEVKTAFPD